MTISTEFHQNRREILTSLIALEVVATLLLWIGKCVMSSWCSWWVVFSPIYGFWLLRHAVYTVGYVVYHSGAITDSLK